MKKKLFLTFCLAVLILPTVFGIGVQISVSGNPPDTKGDVLWSLGITSSKKSFTFESGAVIAALPKENSSSSTLYAHYGAYLNAYYNYEFIKNESSFLRPGLFVGVGDYFVFGGNRVNGVSVMGGIKLGVGSFDALMGYRGTYRLSLGSSYLSGWTNSVYFSLRYTFRDRQQVSVSDLQSAVRAAEAVSAELAPEQAVEPEPEPEIPKVLPIENYQFITIE